MFHILHIIFLIHEIGKVNINTTEKHQPEKKQFLLGIIMTMSKIKLT